MIYSVITGYDVTEPVRGSEDAAGIDISCPKYTEQFHEDFLAKNSPESPDAAYLDLLSGEVVFPAFGYAVIPTGIRMKCNHGEYYEVANRGSVAAKYGLVYGAHIIDSDYQGEVFINLINTRNSEMRIKFGERVAQVLHKEVIMSKPRREDDDKIFDSITGRGRGALGSTGK